MRSPSARPKGYVHLGLENLLHQSADHLGQYRRMTLPVALAVLPSILVWRHSSGKSLTLNVTSPSVHLGEFAEPSEHRQLEKPESRYWLRGVFAWPTGCFAEHPHYARLPTLAVVRSPTMSDTQRSTARSIGMYLNAFSFGTVYAQPSQRVAD